MQPIISTQPDPMAWSSLIPAIEPKTPRRNQTWLSLVMHQTELLPTATWIMRRPLPGGFTSSQAFPVKLSRVTPDLTRALPFWQAAQTIPVAPTDTWTTSQPDGVEIASHLSPSGDVVETPLRNITRPWLVTAQTSIRPAGADGTLEPPIAISKKSIYVLGLKILFKN